MVALSGRKFKKIIQVLDRVMEKVRHADYGYAGLFDRKGHIREDELARVFDYDRDFGKNLEVLKEAVNKTKDEIESEIAGTLVKVMAEDASPVEYDQVLFLVEP